MMLQYFRRTCRDRCLAVLAMLVTFCGCDLSKISTPDAQAHVARYAQSRGCDLVLYRRTGGKKVEFLGSHYFVEFTATLRQREASESYRKGATITIRGSMEFAGDESGWSPCRNGLQTREEKIDEPTTPNGLLEPPKPLIH